MATAWKSVFHNVKEEDSANAVLGDDGTVTRTLNRTWTAVAVDGHGVVEVVDALTASAGTATMPAVGGTMNVSGGVHTVTGLQPRRTGPRSFAVQVTAVLRTTAPPPGGDPGAKFAVDIRIGGKQYTQDAWHDQDKKPIEASSGEPFDPSPTETLYDEQFEVSYKTSAEQSTAFNDVRGKVNKTSLSFNIKGVSRTFDKRCLLCEDVQQSATLPQADGTPVFNVTGTFVHRKDGWVTKILDQGYYTRESPSSRPERLLDLSGDPITSPLKLDGNGGELPPGADAVYREFKQEGEAEFAPVFTGLS